MYTKVFSRKQQTVFCSFLLALLLFCLPAIGKGQNPIQVPDDEEEYSAKQANSNPAGKGVLATLSNLMVKRNQAVMMGVIEDISSEKLSIQMLGQKIMLNNQTNLIGLSKGFTGLKTGQIVIVTVQNIDSKLTAVEIVKLPKSSRKI